MSAQASIARRAGIHRGFSFRFNASSLVATVALAVVVLLARGVIPVASAAPPVSIGNFTAQLTESGTISLINKANGIGYSVNPKAIDPANQWGLAPAASFQEMKDDVENLENLAFNSTGWSMANDGDRQDALGEIAKLRSLLNTAPDESGKAWYPAQLDARDVINLATGAPACRARCLSVPGKIWGVAQGFAVNQAMLSIIDKFTGLGGATTMATMPLTLVALAITSLVAVMWGVLQSIQWDDEPPSTRKTILTVLGIMTIIARNYYRWAHEMAISNPDAPGESIDSADESASEIVGNEVGDKNYVAYDLIRDEL